jgi:TonB-dependent receptor
MRNIMKKQIQIIKFLLSVIIFFMSITIQAQTGRIFGRVTDENSGDALPGASVYLEGTSLGAAANIHGDYYITNIPPSKYTLITKYLGYENDSTDIQLGSNQRMELNIKMKFKVIQGEEVLVTAQAEGQMQAINQQLSSTTIKNIVSKNQIQELPEANAAEAVGRLPGVSLERSGGEGNKVVIRGMAPKYSLIQIDGVDMTATGSDDRSTDLSMISPYMLEGIELTKSVMADQEATATGGIVNFRIRKAPDVSTLNVIAQGGMNSLRSTYNDYKFSLGGSDRFFTKRLGVYAQVDYEKKDNSSQQMGGISFYQANPGTPVRTYSMQLMDIFRNVNRTGAALVLDYSLPSTTIKSSNFFSRIKREETNYNNNYDFHGNSFSIGFDDTPESWLTILTNALQIEHQFGNWEINSTLSHSYSENELPTKISTSNGGSIPDHPFGTDRQSNFDIDMDPETIPDLFIYSMDQMIHNMQLSGINIERSDTRERDLAAELKVAYTFNITEQVNVKLSIGGKIKYKTKKYDETAFGYANEPFILLARNNFEVSQRSKDLNDIDPRNLYLDDFLVKNNGNFLRGRYTFSPLFDKDKFRRLYDLSSAVPDDQLYSIWSFYQPDFTGTNYNDYHGFENYHALYAMPEINIGPKLVVVPGVRYESNRTEYTGYRGNRLGTLRGYEITPIDTVTKVRKNEFLLPMIQIFYKPTDWLIVKAGYTHTLLRPNYDNIMPGWVIGSQGSIDNLSNFQLRPELSRNWDLQFSFHSNEIGLLSFGAFYKKITDMIFWAGKKAILDTAFFELPSIMFRKIAAYAENNENPAYNYGFEFEWQSNFWFLPGFLKGIVIDVNYTLNRSEAKYPITFVKTYIDPVTYKSTIINRDTTYTAPMVEQPDNLLNLMVGYDYKGFSIRWSMRYKSHIFKNADWHEELRGYSTNFYRYDVQIKQKLPIDGLEFFLNVNNLTGEKENDVINHLDFSSYIEDYGRSANLGFRYQY